MGTFPWPAPIACSSANLEAEPGVAPTALEDALAAFYHDLQTKVDPIGLQGPRFAGAYRPVQEQA
jgi:tRNA A37 threonylcarbamoyladenosine synthetase subunit TsaC/SUA5/YrdC